PPLIIGDLWSSRLPAGCSSGPTVATGSTAAGPTARQGGNLPGLPHVLGQPGLGSLVCVRVHAAHIDVGPPRRIRRGSLTGGPGGPARGPGGITRGAGCPGAATGAEQVNARAGSRMG